MFVAQSSPRIGFDIAGGLAAIAEGDGYLSAFPAIHYGSCTEDARSAGIKDRIHFLRSTANRDLSGSHLLQRLIDPHIYRRAKEKPACLMATPR